MVPAPGIRSRRIRILGRYRHGPDQVAHLPRQDGNTRRVVYALDGLRARDDLSDCEIDTDIEQALTAWNINVAMPVDGQSSFYSDSPAPLDTGQTVPYAHGRPSRPGTCALRRPPGWAAIRARTACSDCPWAAVRRWCSAAYHPDQFRYAGSYSGYLNISSPGMRAALLDAGGFGIDAMRGPPWSELWLRNDPFVFARLLRDNGTRMRISSGHGVPGPRDVAQSPLDAYNVVNAMGAEAMALANTRVFQARMDSPGPNNAVFDHTTEDVRAGRIRSARAARPERQRGLGETAKLACGVSDLPVAATSRGIRDMVTAPLRSYAIVTELIH
ncbi:alpha/beta hydrolase-fold protein [Nocardia niigatensis]|uniref:alpha/beta hydrolase-fold protein n=1 Tax=Nocardia niigatensis TaxID=209249 RepID=UPI00278C75A3|nr:alpha/beta hydrolase-fold protein [Nocardia niigatensis]